MYLSPWAGCSLARKLFPPNHAPRQLAQSWHLVKSYQEVYEPALSTDSPRRSTQSADRHLDTKSRPANRGAPPISVCSSGRQEERLGTPRQDPDPAGAHALLCLRSAQVWSPLRRPYLGSPARLPPTSVPPQHSQTPAAQNLASTSPRTAEGCPVRI